MPNSPTEKVVLAIIVENNAGVLGKISMLFGRRGFNIDSLTVSATNDPNVSRITITTQGAKNIIDQVIMQTEKLIEVLAVHREDLAETIQRELLLVKISTNEKERSQLLEICQIYKGSIVDLTKDSLIIELTGKPSKIDAFLEVLSSYSIIEFCRTGVTAIDRGSNAIEYPKHENHRA